MPRRRGSTHQTSCWQSWWRCGALRGLESTLGVGNSSGVTHLWGIAASKSNFDPKDDPSVPMPPLLRLDTVLLNTKVTDLYSV